YTGTIGSQPTVSDVEQKNAGHTWSLQHAGGPLFITYYDDYYGDNQGPGTRLCVEALRCVADTSVTVMVPGTTAWTDSGIDVAAGTRVIISASGSIQYGSLAAQITDPNGGNYDGQTSLAGDVLPPPTITVSLIGKVGGTTDVGTGVPLPE